MRGLLVIAVQQKALSGRIGPALLVCSPSQAGHMTHWWQPKVLVTTSWTRERAQYCGHSCVVLMCCTTSEQVVFGVLHSSRVWCVRVG